MGGGGTYEVEVPFVFDRLIGMRHAETWNVPRTSRG